MQEKLESALANVFSRIFDDFANIFKQEIIKSREEAAALDRKIIEGTGLNSNEFKPIVLFFDIVDKLKTIDDFQSANEFIRKTYNEDTTGMDFYFEYVGESFSAH
ncbi:hypothetical protein [Dyadobacter sp. NIV53]|uniref:hypothetical protein n=1 Tax=Dyadobacter sp. NIV53 TaxID=2861765 RepID=UPI001C87CFC5|nr:hypothetical protein [Dyadobacter sp. NIV53]